MALVSVLICINTMEKQQKMFQSTLTGKAVTFQEYLMLESEPSSYGGETREPKSWKISHTKSEKKIKKGKNKNI